MTELRVLTYNVRGTQDDVATLTRIVRAADPDVLCVQESPRVFRWRSRCARLARECGLTYVVGGGTGAGTLVLAHLRVQVRDRGATLLRPTQGRHRRGLAWAVLERAGVRVRISSLHLGLDASERVRHVAEVLAVLQPDPTLAVDVLAGDLNEGSTGRAWQALLSAGFVDLAAPSGRPTFPATRPRHRIDTVLVRPRPGAASADVPDGLEAWARPGRPEDATDHLPVLAVLPLATGGQTPDAAAAAAR